MDDIYKEIILENYKHPQNFGRLKKPDRTCMLANTLCGDEIGIDIKVLPNPENPQTNVIGEISFYGVGCAISVASASLLTEHVKGKSIDKVLKVSKDDIINMLGITLSPTRTKCALLALEVLHKTIHLLK